MENVLAIIALTLRRRSMNTGGRIVNVQWDFDFRDRVFSAMQGYQLCRKGGKGESGF
jgi:hypothetical protein